MSTAFGIDIGSDKCVVAYVNKNGVVDVLQNEASKRETPVVVHFDKAQRLFGAAGAARANMDPNSTISQLKRLIGRRFDDPSIKKAFSLPANDTNSNDNSNSYSKGPIVEGPNGEAMVSVRYRNEDRSFTAVQMLGMFLCYIKRMVEKTTKLVMSDCVIGIPSYLTDQQRKDYLLAAEIAGLKPLRLFHDGAATALDYGIHRKLPHGEVTNVVFVDIGHGDTQVTVVKFWFGTATVLAHSFDRDLGGRDFDDVIFELFAGDFQEKCGVDVRRNPKATFRLRAACEKAKKVLSSNSDAQINIECLAGDHDLNGAITRTGFEKLASGLLERIKAACKRALVDAELFETDIHSVELVGSGSRIPIISDVLRDFFGRETSRTLNGSECIANGCALQCAMLNSAPEAGVFGVVDRMPFSVVGFPACENSSTSTNMIGKGSFLLSPRMLTLQPSKSVTISYENLSDMPCGVSPYIKCYKVSSENAAKKYNLNIRVQYNIHGIIAVNSVALQPINVAPKQIEPCGPELAGQKSDPPAVDNSTAQGLKQSLESQSDGHKCLAFPEEKIDKIKERRPLMISEVEQDRTNEHDKNRRNIRENSIYKMHNEHAVISSGISLEGQDVMIFEIPLIEDSKKALENACELEKKLREHDDASERAKIRRNELEAYLYRIRDELSRGFGNLASKPSRDLVDVTLKSTGEWLEESGAVEPEQAYFEKKRNLDLVLRELVEDHEKKKKDDFLIRETEKLREFKMKFKGMDELDYRKLDDKWRVISSIVKSPGVIPKEEYEKLTEEMDTLLGEIGGHYQDAESRSRQDGTFTWVLNSIFPKTNLPVRKPPAGQTIYDRKDSFHGIHCDPSMKDDSSGPVHPSDESQSLSVLNSFSSAAPAINSSPGNQQSNISQPQPMDVDMPSSAHSQKDSMFQIYACQKDNSSGVPCPTDGTQNFHSSPFVIESDTENQQSNRTSNSLNISRGSDNAIIYGSNIRVNNQTSASPYKGAVSGGSSSVQPPNSRVSPHYSTGQSCHTQKRSNPRKPTNSIKKDDYIVIRGRPCQVVDISIVKANKQWCCVEGIDILKDSRLTETVPLARDWDVPCFGHYFYNKKLKNGYAQFLAASGDEFRSKFSPNQYEELEAKLKEGLVLRLEVVSWFAQKPENVIIASNYVPAQ